MPLYTLALSASLTPTVIQTLINHYLHRNALHNQPTIHISYDEGMHIMRQFLFYASKHPLEDLQAFTSQTVPSPHWVRTETVTVPEEYLSSAADAITKQLGPKGVVRVGGEKWWQWRGPSGNLEGEWIEMRRHYNEAKKANQPCKRIILYVHGGAYFFGSLDTHRYMMQRHARKLKGRVFAPDYRLAPQFPFPCCLQDCVASYLWLLTMYDPSEIIVAGDSAGGGLALSMLVVLRDQGIPLPAGGILISPWVDLTHSFPSIVEDNPLDYIPEAGFMYKPSIVWPPPNSDELLEIKKMSQKETVTAKDVEDVMPDRNSLAKENAIRGYTVHHTTTHATQPAYPGLRQNPDPATTHGEPDNIQVVLDGKTIELKDQIQMYATNQLMSHPLVSPVLQPSLGGLPPLQILSGGGEKLRDEQFYVAHKAADPTAYPPADVYLDEHDPDRETLNKYEPTYVQFQVWDNLCHVAPMLSFTRPAKYMFRSVAQFGSWALARAQKTGVEIEDENVISPVSSSGSDGPASQSSRPVPRTATSQSVSSVGKAGDPLPPFRKYMIRQRVDKRGRTYPLDPPSSYPVLQIPPAHVGAINPELIRKWMGMKHEWDLKFANQKLHFQKRRIKEMVHGLKDFDGEYPPACSLAARRAAPGVLPKRRAKKNYGLMLWSGWGSKHDEHTMRKEDRVEKAGGRATRTSVDAGQAGAGSSEPSRNGQQKTFSASGHQSKTSAPATVTWGENKRPNMNNSTERPSGDASSAYARPVSEKSAGPILVLPEVDNLKLSDENASTRALFHAAGTIPMTSDVSLSHSQHQPGSAAGSLTGRSELMSDGGEDGSTVGGDKDSVAVTSTAPDGASTRAVIGATGVVRPVNPDNGRLSTDALPPSAKEGRTPTPNPS